MVESESFGKITEGLLRDNLTDEQVRGILGLNWLRVAREVWNGPDRWGLDSLPRVARSEGT